MARGSALGHGTGVGTALGRIAPGARPIISSPLKLNLKVMEQVRSGAGRASTIGRAQQPLAVPDCTGERLMSGTRVGSPLNDRNQPPVPVAASRPAWCVSGLISK